MPVNIPMILSPGWTVQNMFHKRGLAVNMCNEKRKNKKKEKVKAKEKQI
jgi:hypothetical protein